MGHGLRHVHIRLIALNMVLVLVSVSADHESAIFFRISVERASFWQMVLLLASLSEFSLFNFVAQ